MLLPVNTPVFSAAQLERGEVAHVEAAWQAGVRLRSSWPGWDCGKFWPKVIYVTACHVPFASRAEDFGTQYYWRCGKS